MNESVLPKRSGSRPKTTPTNPHTQLEQNPEREVVDELATRVFALPGVEERPSAISVPGTRALWLREELPIGPQEAFLIGREFAHIHPMPDGSLHAALPPEVAQEALERFAMILGCTASWGNERVLVGPEKEDRRGQGTGHAHRRSRPLLRRGHLHRQALRSRGPQREAARSEEAPRLQAEAGRRSKQAPGSGSRRASGGHPLPKARVLAESGRGFGQ